MPHDQAYTAAQKKIEQALQSGATELDLSNEYYTSDEKKLTELPESIGKLKQLTSLKLSGNQLTTLPEPLSQLTQLQTLDISHNRLTTLPEPLLQLAHLQTLNLSYNRLTTLPDSLSQLAQLQSLNLSGNQLSVLPESLGNLIKLTSLNFYSNRLSTLPYSLGQIKHLKDLQISENKITRLPVSIQGCIELETLDIAANYLSILPDSLGTLAELWRLNLSVNNFSDLPSSLGNIRNLRSLDLASNPLNSELASAYSLGTDAVKAYLRAKAKGGQITLNEAKLILIGEGEVGKTCLMDALLGNPWQEHDTTHGIQIKQIKVNDPETHAKITLNGWDFGGQRVYRPTHQLFFSAPAVYLVVWKPREGPQQGFVKDWIKLIKHREPDAKILVVATHGGPQQRQPDIDRQELWDLFGRETVVDFFFVDSKPNAHGNRKGIQKLKDAIACLAAGLPEVGRSVPKSFADARAALQARNVPYLPLADVLAICHEHKMDDEIADLFITISHRLGHLTHYQHDPALRDIVILRPDWLATAMSYVLDDEATRKAHGLVRFSHLGHLWDDPNRPADTRYPAALHRIFLNLMGRFDLSYPVPEPPSPGTGAALLRPNDSLSLISQFVPDNRPDNFAVSWLEAPASGDIQQTQICRIVDEKGNTAAAEGLFYQLIVRLHKYSLGRAAYADSVHWQRGLVLDDDYNGRALLEHKGNDVHITVSAAFPERFLAMLTEEVKYLVESFWEGLRCDVMVPCLNATPCIGLFEVRKLIENKKRGRPEQPCPVCNEWQDIDCLLSNAPAATPPVSLDTLLKEFAQVKDTLSEVNDNTKRILSQVDKQYADLIQIFTDEAKEGPRLFSLFPLDRSNFTPKGWIRAQFRLVLWCEHSRLPLPVINGADSKKGVYDLDLDREWFKKASPYLKLLSGTLGMVLPVASSAFKLALDDTAYKLIEEQLDFSKNLFDATLGEAAKITDFIGAADSTDLEHGVAIRGESATLRELQALLKAKDPGFGGLVRVLNKRQEFLWVHEQFAGEY